MRIPADHLQSPRKDLHLTRSPRRLPTALRRLTALTAASTALVILSGCVVTGTTRGDDEASDSATVESYRKNARDNLAAADASLRSYAVVDETSTPTLHAHLFGLPGADSLNEATERTVLDSFRAAGAFAGRKAFSPVLTDPSLRWDPAAFTAPTAASAGSTGKDTDTGADVDISNRVVAAGGDFLLSAVTQTDAAGPTAGPGSGSTRVFVTDLSADTTVDAAELFVGDVEDSAISVDDSGALLLDGESARGDELTDLGRRVADSLHTPLSLPQAADDRDPDYSCALLPCVALTYDDGPGPTEVEDRLLAAAESAKVRLTYFLLGKNVRHNPGVVRRMAEAGHELGNHSFDHPQMSKKSPETVRKQVEETDADIDAAGGGKPTLVRPPYGALTKATAKALGHPAVMWDVDTEDWRSKKPDSVVEAVKSQTKPGSVVLMHSIHASTVDAAPEVFRTVLDRGFYPVTVSDLFGDRSLEKGAEYFCRGYATKLCSNPEHPAVHRN